MKLRSAAVIGAGAVGAYFISCLALVLGESLSVIAEGKRAEQLRQEGISINGKRPVLHIRTPEEAANADLYIVAVKYNALPGAVSLLRRSVGENSIVVCPMNGVDCERILREGIGEARVIDSMMKIISRRVGNAITFDAEKTVGLYFGEADGQPSERVAAMAELFYAAGLHYQVSANILRDMWYKYALNVCQNIPQAILNCGQGAYAANAHVAHLEQKLREEVIRVAAAKGIDISGDDPIGRYGALPYDTRLSTLQDLDAKRATEVDSFCGALCRMGQELGIATPYADFAYHAIRALEDKNAGLLR